MHAKTVALMPACLRACTAAHTGTHHTPHACARTGTHLDTIVNAHAFYSPHLHACAALIPLVNINTLINTTLVRQDGQLDVFLTTARRQIKALEEDVKLLQKMPC